MLQDIVAKLFKALVDSALGAILQSYQEAKRNAQLQELGYDKAVITQMDTERKVAAKAKAIDSAPTPHDIRDITRRL